MGATIPTPAAGTESDSLVGLSDIDIDYSNGNSMYKFMGATITSCNMTLGFNGSPSSLSVELVEDTYNGDSFVEPTLPSVYGFALPSGGIGAPLFMPSGTVLNQANAPFYFAGLATNYTQDIINAGGRKITVNFADPSELLGGIQCLLGGFSLSQNIGAGSPRYADVLNVIDVFGFYDYGMDADLNEFGITWNQAKTVIESVKTTLFDIDFEFVFSGSAFTDAPDWYRVQGDAVSLTALINQVADDGGSDVIYIGRKVTASKMMVEIRGIRRSNANILYQSEIDDFVQDRDGIVNYAKQGQEMRNEPTSKIIIGGRRNKNYVAWPTKIDPQFRESGIITWPSSTKARMFGGDYTIVDDAGDDVSKTSNVEVGAIFPFWGFAPDGQTPLAEPFLPLDQLAFRDDTSKLAIPVVALKNEYLTTRTVTDTNGYLKHSEMFLNYDDESDGRPWAVVSGYLLSQSSKPTDYIRGLPLNEEVMFASLINQEIFELTYRANFSGVAVNMGMLSLDTDYLNKWLDEQSGELGWVKDKILAGNPSVTRVFGEPINISHDRSYQLKELRGIVFDAVKNYTLDNVGKQFIVVLPKSKIMDRIFQGSGVPTRTEKPDIEYVVDNIGYWEILPSEFDGLADTPAAESIEKQIRDRFMAEDGRFFPMAVLNNNPEGNASFWSDSFNTVMFQDLPTSDFRPNRIAESTPDRVFIAPAQISQLIKRPDLALMSLPTATKFDPIGTFGSMPDYSPPDATALPASINADSWLTTRGHFARFLWRLSKQDQNFKEWIAAALLADASLSESDIINTWADQLFTMLDDPDSVENSLEALRCMDLEAVIIPLTSTWSSYGPWYKDSSAAKGMIQPEIDQSLVPWNFARPTGVPNTINYNIFGGSGVSWADNLNIAGEERLDRSLSVLDYIDTASISVAGFPEIGVASTLGFNSNVTSISVDFGVGQVTTVYELSTYSRRPGTFRKSDFDDISQSLFKLKPVLPDVRNLNLSFNNFGPGNQFRGRSIDR